MRQNEIYHPPEPMEQPAGLRPSPESTIRLDPARSSGRHESFETSVALVRLAARLDDQSDWLRHFHDHFKDLHLLVVNIERKVETVMTTQAELAAELVALKDQVAKARQENADAKARQLARIDELEQALAAAAVVIPDVTAALDALRSEVQGADDDNPDAAPVDTQQPTDPEQPTEPADPGQNQ